jgi:hypothetical protein
MLEHTRAVPPITLDLPEDAISTTTSLMLTERSHQGPMGSDWQNAGEIRHEPPVVDC